MRRKSRLENIDPFGNEIPAESGGLSFEDVDESLFGGKLAQLDSGRDVIKPVPIHDIYPDPSQPRRALPSAIRRYWSGTDSMGTLLAQWYELVVHERGQELDLGIYLRTDEEAIHSDQCGPFETAFLQVIDLAASIRRDGLTNPVTIARTGRNYRLETGERRWLAYHMLYNYFDGSTGRPDERKTWAKIPARQVETVDVWRQANENNARENLNAISKARQFAVLLMNLLGQNNFQPFEATDHEKDYYAQVADAAQYRVPSGKN
ncbi:MAG: ParB N-terminal domain-containing protein, partial [Anaerolineae bacterium]|nr:ParB N-terminal domain-containing protein [Anaerolineae bacterium]